MGGLLAWNMIKYKREAEGMAMSMNTAIAKNDSNGKAVLVKEDRYFVHGNWPEDCVIGVKDSKAMGFE